MATRGTSFAARAADRASSSERISVCAGDITDPADRDALVAALAQLAAPRGVVHAAGTFQTGLLDTLSTDDWRRSFAVNVEARWALSRESVDLLDHGRILFIGSDAGTNPRPGAAAYSIAQAASETLRRALQAAWAQGTTAVARFAAWLLLDVPTRRFVDTEWDIRDGEHHAEWSDGPLHLDAADSSTNPVSDARTD